MSEVLDRQDPGTRRFLLCTSILERLSGPLCDAVLETEGSAHRLVAIERANLFLVALDGRRVWYRYHQLFRDLLMNELHMSEAQQARRTASASGSLAPRERLRRGGD